MHGLKMQRYKMSTPIEVQNVTITKYPLQSESRMSPLQNGCLKMQRPKIAATNSRSKWLPENSYRKTDKQKMRAPKIFTREMVDEKYTSRNDCTVNWRAVENAYYRILTTKRLPQNTCEKFYFFKQL